MADDVCVACRANRGEMPTPGGVIYQDTLWRLEHAFEPIPLVGWLVLKPLRHVEAFADLTLEEAATFGPLLHRITGAMTEALRPIKVYVSLYAEAENAAHIHFHLIPRHEDVPHDRLGPWIFHYLQEASRERRNMADVGAAEDAAVAVREKLESPDARSK